MITSVLLYVLSFILSLVSALTDFIAQGWSVWPASVLSGITYFFTQLMNWDFLINVVALLTAIKWLVGFEVLYLSTKLVLKIINWVRGAGPIDLK